MIILYFEKAVRCVVHSAMDGGMSSTSALNYLTIPELKDRLRTRGLKLSGNKSTLVNRLHDDGDLGGEEVAGAAVRATLPAAASVGGGRAC